MSMTELQTFIDSFENTDKSDINLIKKVAEDLKKSADNEIITVTQESTAAIDAEYKEIIDAVIAERNAIKKSLTDKRAAQELQNQTEHDRYVSFFSIAKQMKQTFKASAAGKYIDIEWNIDKKLDRLEAVGIDLLDDATYALMFKDTQGLNITSLTDFNRMIETVKHVNKHVMINNEYAKAVTSFHAIGAIDVDGDYHAKITAALDSFTSKINTTAENHAMGTKEAYALFFYNMSDALDGNTIETQDEFKAYTAELFDRALGADIKTIQATYNELKSLNYGDVNYVGALQTRTLAIKDMVATTSARYERSADDICAKAFSDINVSNESGLDTKLLAHSYDINIRDILNNISALKVTSKTEVNAGFIESVDAIDLSENRLKIAGVSDETAEKISDLKAAFITALNDNVPTRDIERELGTTAIHAQSEMDTKHLTYLCKLTA
tara:strand:+ start:163 stop:1482 length:1320 start_codon:yes stop_codon:yes gene_type:complete